MNSFCTYDQGLKTRFLPKKSNLVDFYWLTVFVGFFYVMVIAKSETNMADKTWWVFRCKVETSRPTSEYLKGRVMFY